MTTVLNLIDKDKRFAKHSGQEYNVFSRTLRNPSNIEKWVGLTKPNWVLMDPESYWSLRGEHIEWIFDDENSLTGVKVHKKEESKGESKTQPDIEEMEEEIASKIVESKTQPDIEEMEEEITSKIVEERPAIEERETLQIDTEQIEEKEDEIREIANTLDELEL